MPILLFTIVLFGIGFGLVIPGMPFVAQNFGATPFWASFTLGLYAWGQLISTLIWGRLSDRIGRKPVLIVTGVGVSLAYLLMAFAPNLFVLAAARFLSGLMGGIAPAMAYAADVTPPEKRAQSIGWIGASMSSGFILGPAIGGLLGGSTAADASLFWPGIVAFVLAAGTALATALYLKESLPPEKRAGSAERGADGQSLALRHIVRRPLMVEILVLGFAVYVAMAMFENIFPFWARERFAWGPRQVGLAFTWLAVVVAVVQGFVVGRVAPRIGEGRLAISGIAAYAVGLVVMTFGPSLGWMLLGITLTSGGSGVYLTAMSTFVTNTAQAHERGTVLGVYQSASWGGRAVGPSIAGLFYATLGHDAPLLAAATIMLPCVALLAYITSQHARPAESGG